MDRPNLLLITTDQQRFDALGINGNRVLRTANLDHWAAGGVNFVRAYTTCPSCIAVRRGILTGQHPVTHGMVGYRDGVEFTPDYTLPALLGAAGYQTQLIGKLHMFPQRKRFGFDDLILSETPHVRPDSPFFSQNDYAEWLVRHGHRFPPDVQGIDSNSWLARPSQLPEDLHHSSFLVSEAIDFLTRRRDPTCPWFLHLSFSAPHPPLTPPQIYWDRYVRSPPLRPHVGEWVPPFEDDWVRGLSPWASAGPFRAEDIHETIAGYYGLIHHIDDRLGYLFTRCFRYGGAQRPTWVIFCSDHGEMLGDHHLFRKTLPHEGSAHVPFFIFGLHGAQVAAATCDALVCHEDILPTLCELAGVAVPEAVEGRSLVPILRGQAAGVREHLFGEHSGPFANHFLVRGRHKYCWYARTGEEQLFDLEADPYELHDLSADAALLEPMRRQMAAHLAGREDYTYDPAKLKPLANRPPSGFWDAH
jgi:arylsulfatase A-like enzyme